MVMDSWKIGTKIIERWIVYPHFREQVQEIFRMMLQLKKIPKKAMVVMTGICNFVAI